MSPTNYERDWPLHEVPSSMAKPLQAVGVDVSPLRTDVRGAFDAAYDAADAQETRQRLDGLTRARAVAPIVADVEHAAIAGVRKLLEERNQAVAAWREAEAAWRQAEADLCSTRDEMGRFAHAIGMLETALDLPVGTDVLSMRLAVCLQRVDDDVRAAFAALRAQRSAS